MLVSVEDIKSSALFAPWRTEQAIRARESQQPFVHYTTAETALKIIRSGCFWMRNASLMNDYSEVSYGWEKLAAAYTSRSGKRLGDLLNGIFPRIHEELTQILLSVDRTIGSDIYISCFSEHQSSEAELGRLSMWRAYGGKSGVALVLKHDPFFSKGHVFNAPFSPVSYFDDTTYQFEFNRLIDALENGADQFKALGPDRARDSLLASLIDFAICTKHPGFAEEQEWRLWTHSKIAPDNQPSRPKFKCETEVIASKPQPVWKFPLENCPERKAYGRTIPEIIDRLIIGPTDGPHVLWETFVQELGLAGVDQPWSKVTASKIPLRQ